ncbi:trichohyalin-like isoform X2 [Protopterus annectens]|uniref:trichohyalin-like isoform X2 n=1 Tax=Protopterus annectens TaxID=7888 RepID=UPI001CFB63B1|nr:trichohyalin-like isoform X2 [Protopterus annectens]
MEKQCLRSQAVQTEKRIELLMNHNPSLMEPTTERSVVISVYKKKFLHLLGIHEIALEISQQCGVPFALKLEADLTIIGPSVEQIQTAEKILHGLIVEKEISTTLEIFSHTEWHMFKKIILAKFNRHRVKIEIFDVKCAHEMPGIFKVIIVGFKAAVVTLKTIIAEFLCNRIQTKECIPIKRNQIELVESLEDVFGFQHTNVEMKISQHRNNVEISITGPKRYVTLTKEYLMSAIPRYYSFMKQSQQSSETLISRASGYCFALMGGITFTVSLYDTKKEQGIKLLIKTDDERFPPSQNFSDTVSYEEECQAKSPMVAVTLHSKNILVKGGNLTKQVTATALMWNSSDGMTCSYRALETCLNDTVHVVLKHTEEQQRRALFIQYSVPQEDNNELVRAIITSVISAVDSYSNCRTPPLFLQSISLQVNSVNTLNQVRDACIKQWPLGACTQISLSNALPPWGALKTTVGLGLIEDSRADVLVVHVSYDGDVPAVLTLLGHEGSRDLNIMLKAVSEVITFPNREVVTIPVSNELCANFHCHCIILVSLDEYDDTEEKPDMMLSRIVSRCLERCHSYFFKSIAFPVFDLRRFGMSYKQTMETMLEQIALFGEETPATWIRTAEIVLPPEYTNSRMCFEDTERILTTEFLEMVIGESAVFMKYFNDNADAATDLQACFHKLGFCFHTSGSLHIQTDAGNLLSMTQFVEKMNFLETIFKLVKSKYEIYIECNPSLSALLTADIWKPFHSIRVYNSNIIVGLQAEVTEVKKALNVAAQDRQHVKREQKVHSIAKYLLVSSILANKLSTQFPHLKHTVEPASGLLKLEGCHREVCLAEEEYGEMLKKLISCQVQLCEYRKRFLKFYYEKCIWGILRTEEFHIILEIGENIELCGISDTELRCANDYLDKFICLKIINTESELQSPTFSEDLKDIALKLKESINKESKKIDIYTELGKNNNINVVIAGLCKEVFEAEAEIKEYLNTFVLIEVRIAFGRPELLRFRSIVLELLQKMDVDVALEDNTQSKGLDIVLKGKKQNVERAIISVQQELNSIVCSSEIINCRAMQYLTEEQTLRIVGKHFQCILQLKTPEWMQLFVIGKGNHAIKAKEALLKSLDSIVLSQCVPHPLINTVFQGNIDRLQEYCVTLEASDSGIIVTGLAKYVHQCCMEIQSQLISLHEKKIETLKKEIAQILEQEQLIRNENNAIKMEVEKKKKSNHCQILKLCNQIRIMKCIAKETDTTLQYQITNIQTVLQERANEIKTVKDENQQPRGMPDCQKYENADGKGIMEERESLDSQTEGHGQQIRAMKHNTEERENAIQISHLHTVQQEGKPETKKLKEKKNDQEEEQSLKTEIKNIDRKMKTTKNLLSQQIKEHYQVTEIMKHNAEKGKTSLQSHIARVLGLLHEREEEIKDLKEKLKQAQEQEKLARNENYDINKRLKQTHGLFEQQAVEYGWKTEMMRDSHENTVNLHQNRNFNSVVQETEEGKEVLKTLKKKRSKNDQHVKNKKGINKRKESSDNINAKKTEVINGESNESKNVDQIQTAVKDTSLQKRPEEMKILKADEGKVENTDNCNMNRITKTSENVQGNESAEIGHHTENTECKNENTKNLCHITNQTVLQDGKHKIITLEEKKKACNGNCLLKNENDDSKKMKQTKSLQEQQTAEHDHQTDNVQCKVEETKNSPNITNVKTVFQKREQETKLFKENRKETNEGDNLSTNEKEDSRTIKENEDVNLKNIVENQLETERMKENAKTNDTLSQTHSTGICTELQETGTETKPLKEQEELSEEEKQPHKNEKYTKNKRVKMNLESQQIVKNGQTETMQCKDEETNNSANVKVHSVLQKREQETELTKENRKETNEGDNLSTNEKEDSKTVQENKDVNVKKIREHQLETETVKGNAKTSDTLSQTHSIDICTELQETGTETKPLKEQEELSEEEKQHHKNEKYTKNKMVKMNSENQQIVENGQTETMQCKDEETNNSANDNVQSVLQKREQETELTKENRKETNEGDNLSTNEKEHSRTIKENEDVNVKKIIEHQLETEHVKDNAKTSDTLSQTHSTGICTELQETGTETKPLKEQEELSEEEKQPHKNEKYTKNKMVKMNLESQQIVENGKTDTMQCKDEETNNSANDNVQSVLQKREQETELTKENRKETNEGDNLSTNEKEDSRTIKENEDVNVKKIIEHQLETEHVKDNAKTSDTLSQTHSTCICTELQETGTETKPLKEQEELSEEEKQHHKNEKYTKNKMVKMNSENQQIVENGQTETMQCKDEETNNSANVNVQSVLQKREQETELTKEYRKETNEDDNLSTNEKEDSRTIKENEDVNVKKIIEHQLETEHVKDNAKTSDTLSQTHSTGICTQLQETGTETKPLKEQEELSEEEKQHHKNEKFTKNKMVKMNSENQQIVENGQTETMQCKDEETNNSANVNVQSVLQKREQETELTKENRKETNEGHNLSTNEKEDSRTIKENEDVNVKKIIEHQLETEHIKDNVKTSDTLSQTHSTGICTELQETGTETKPLKEQEELSEEEKQHHKNEKYTKNKMVKMNSENQQIVENGQTETMQCKDEETNNSANDNVQSVLQKREQETELTKENRKETNEGDNLSTNEKEDSRTIKENKDVNVNKIIEHQLETEHVKDNAKTSDTLSQTHSTGICTELQETGTETKPLKEQEELSEEEKQHHKNEKYTKNKMVKMNSENQQIVENGQTETMQCKDEETNNSANVNVQSVLQKREQETELTKEYRKETNEGDNLSTNEKEDSRTIKENEDVNVKKIIEHQLETEHMKDNGKTSDTLSQTHSTGICTELQETGTETKPLKEQEELSEEEKQHHKNEKYTKNKMVKMNSENQQIVENGQTETMQCKDEETNNSANDNVQSVLQKREQETELTKENRKETNEGDNLSTNEKEDSRTIKENKDVNVNKIIEHQLETEHVKDNAKTSDTLSQTHSTGICTELQETGTETKPLKEQEELSEEEKQHHKNEKYTKNKMVKMNSENQQIVENGQTETMQCKDEETNNSANVNVQSVLQKENRKLN